MNGMMDMRLSRLWIALLISGLGFGSAYGDPVSAGRKAWFQWNCNGCHGNRAGGGMGPNIVGTELHDVVDAVLNCNALERGMRTFSSHPAFDCAGAGVAVPSGLAPVPTPPGAPTATDLSNIAQYLAAIENGTDPRWVDWWNH
jgi:mono/diheme cytochrome c family protein